MFLYLSSIVRTELTSFWEEFHKEGTAYMMGIVHSHEDEGKLAFLKKCNTCIRHFHISHNAPYLIPKILHNLCFSFLVGITAVPRKIENSAYAKIWGASKVDYEKCGSGVWYEKGFFTLHPPSAHLL